MAVPSVQYTWKKELKLVARFCIDYLRGVIRFKNHTPCITVYGSAGFEPDHPFYKQAKALGYALASKGFTVMTGGGPGLMEAVNSGAQSAGKSMGCSIRIPQEKIVNDYIDHSLICRCFATRKLLMTRFSCGFVALPGGFGTLDELFEMVTLIKTDHMRPFPIILVDQAYWQPMLDFLNKSVLKSGAISQKELDMLTVVDSVEEALACIEDQHDANT